MKRELVEKGHSTLSLQKQCGLLELNRSSYYHKTKPESEENLLLMKRIDELYLEQLYFGSRKMRDALVLEGHRVNRKRVQRLMALMGIEAVYCKPKTSKRNPRHPVFPYLLKGLTIDRPMQVWCADITYIRLKSGWAYLVAVMDWFSRKILSWKVSVTMEADFCVRAVEEALERYGRPEIFNTDQGSQFTSSEFISAVHKDGTRLSMDGKGRFMDNIFIERFWRSLKYERVYLCEYETVSESRQSIAEYINTYNVNRPHASLDGQTPNQVFSLKAKTAA